MLIPNTPFWIHGLYFLEQFKSCGKIGRIIQRVPRLCPGDLVSLSFTSCITWFPRRGWSPLSALTRPQVTFAVPRCAARPLGTGKWPVSSSTALRVPVAHLFITGYSPKWAESLRPHRLLHTSVYSSFIPNCQDLGATEMFFGSWTDRDTVAGHRMECRSLIKSHELLSRKNPWQKREDI